MTKGEWSGWMQAVFSVVAIAGAIGIAWWQLSKQHERETGRLLANAKLTADSLRADMFYAQVWLNEMSRRLKLIREAGTKYHASSDLIMAKSVKLPSDEQLLHLTPVWPGTAAAIVKYRGGLLMLREMLDAVNEIQVAEYQLPGGEAAKFEHICNSILLFLKQALDGLPMDNTWTDPINIPAKI